MIIHVSAPDCVRAAVNFLAVCKGWDRVDSASFWGSQRGRDHGMGYTHFNLH